MTKQRNKKKKLVAKGTGLHIDSNLYNMWKTERITGENVDLERLRAFQSFVALSDANKDKEIRDGGLEVVPGFHLLAENYFAHLPDRTGRRNVQSWGPYVTGFNAPDDQWIKECICKVQRIPNNWQPTQLDKSPSPNVESVIEKAKHIVQEHERLEFVPIQKGDFILWDIRLPHQNSDANETNVGRFVFYHAYLPARVPGLNKIIEEIKTKRPTRDHISDFSTRWNDIEKEGLPEQKPLETPFEKMLYNEQEWDVSVGDELIAKHGHLLTEKHISFYNQFGYVVIENLIETSTCENLYNQILSHAKFLGCDVESLLEGGKITGDDWNKIGGTFGAMVEFFWLPWQEKIRFDERTYAITASLLSKTWTSGAAEFQCPFSDKIDHRALWLYNDRVNIRIPDSIVQSLQMKQ